MTGPGEVLKRIKRKLYMNQKEFEEKYPTLVKYGYTMDELDKDNPYNQWMYEDQKSEEEEEDLC